MKVPWTTNDLAEVRLALGTPGDQESGECRKVGCEIDDIDAEEVV